jgi:hypothetical protein
VSGSSLVQHFGLGSDAHPDALEVAWPSGARTAIHQPPVDRRLRLEEPAEVVP